MITITISRSTGGDLILSDDPTGTFVLPEDGLREPDITWRYGYAPPSSDLHGQVLLAAVKEHSSLPFAVDVHGTSAADLAARRQELAEALEQWSYTATLDVNGQATVWSCDPTSPRWADLDSGMVRAHMAKATVVIPVYPIPGA